MYRTVFTLTCIDDGSWDAHGPIEELDKARDRCEKALSILKDYEDGGEWFSFEELKDDFQSCGLYLKTH